MANFAVLDADNVVVNVIVADSLEIATTATGANCVELPEIGFGINDLYDGKKFIHPPVSEATDSEVK